MPHSHIAVAVVLLAATPLIAADTMPIGVAHVDITPETPVRMYGYASRKTESESVAGPLTARAIALGKDDDQGLAVLLCVDCGSVPTGLRDRVFQRVAERQEIRPERFVLSHSHCHSGPNLKGMESLEGQEFEHLAQYAKLLEDRLVQVVSQAIEARRPCRLAFAQGQVGFAANRRVLTDGKWSGFGAVPDAPVDHSLPMLRVTAADGSLVAVVANYACHCTTLRGNFKQIHGDWAACAAADIEGANPGAVALITIGCGADADPCPHGTTDLCEQHGESLADEAQRLLAGEWKPITGPLTAKLKTLEVQTLPYRITTWTFGVDLAMVFLSNEVVVDYALRMKRELDADRLWITAYAHEVSGYIVSKRLIGEGGYEVKSSISAQLTDGHPEELSPAMEDRIVECVKSMLPETHWGNDE